MSITWSKNVFSKTVAEVGYDEENKDLYVTWLKGGKRSVYANVPEELAHQLANAPSVGSMVRTEIIPYYSHRYG